MPAAIVLRTHRPGDLGWIIHRQAALYHAEYGWDGTFEAMLAEIAAKFIREFDPVCERCWLAEREGEGAVLGSVSLVRAAADTAKLRMLYVEPAARGLGVGRLLVGECLSFARQAGYRRVTLWTNDILTAARRIYVDEGFELVSQARHHSFGQDLVGQEWALTLR